MSSVLLLYPNKYIIVQSVRSTVIIAKESFYMRITHFNSGSLLSICVYL